MRRIVRVGVVLLMVSAARGALAQGLVIGGDRRGALPFTIGPSTTVVETVDKQGQPDYVAAINERFGKGVTAQDNGFVLWLRVVGIEQMLPSNRAAVLEKLGVKELEVGGKFWESSMAWAARRGLDASMPPQLSEAGKAVWTVTDRPEVAAFLKDQDELLSLAEEASKKPQWFCPMVASEGTALGAAPRYVNSSDILRSIAARSMLRAGAGDFAGFRADIQTLTRLGERFGSSPLVIERLMGVVAQSEAQGALDGAATAHAFTQAQWEQLATDLAPTRAIDFIEPLDVTERFGRLAMAAAVATGKLWKGAVPPDPVSRRLAALDRDAVDWDLVMEGINERYDHLIAAMRMGPGPQREAAEAALEERRQADMKTAQQAPATSSNVRTSNALWVEAALAAGGMDARGMATRADAAREVRAKLVATAEAQAADKRRDEQAK